MATLLDTSALAVLLHRSAPYPEVARASREELLAGRALLSVVSAAELLVRARGAAGAARLRALIESLPAVSLNLEVAILAGRLGAYARRRGSTIPLPDLLIAATALRLEIPLLTTDSDFVRGRRIAAEDEDPDDTARLWQALQIHPAANLQ